VNRPYRSTKVAPSSKQTGKQTGKQSVPLAHKVHSRPFVIQPKVQNTPILQKNRSQAAQLDLGLIQNLGLQPKQTTGSADGKPGGARTIQCKMAFSSAKLGKMPSMKATLHNSTYHRIRRLHQKYLKTSKLDKEFHYLKDIDWLAKSWLDARQGGAANTKKLTNLTQLRSAIAVELPKLNTKLNQQEDRDYLVREIGIAEPLINPLSDVAVNYLIDASKAFAQGNLQVADAALYQLKQFIPDSITVLKSRLVRFHIKKLHPELAKAMSPEFQLDKRTKRDQDTLDLAEAQVQGTVDDNLDKLHALGGADKDSAKMMENTHRNLKGKADSVKKKDADFSVLEPGEIMAITGYTTDFYGEINNPLRALAKPGKRDLDSKSMAWTKAGISGLNKLPKYNGITFRHAGFFPGYKAINQVGGIVSDLAFSSSAVQQRSCPNAAKSHDALEIIFSKTGREISQASVFGEKEAEVLFRPGTEFRVEARMDKDMATDTWPMPNKKLMAYLNSDPKKDVIQVVILKREV